MIKALIFDLDDTLYYEWEFVLEGFRAVSKYLGVKYHLETDVLLRDMIGFTRSDGRGRIFNSICDKYNFEEDITGLIDIYRNVQPKIELYEDSKNVLRRLRNNGYKLGVITDGDRKVQNSKIKALNVKEYVDSIIVTDELGRENWKPSTIPFELMASELQLIPNECMYIGDNPRKDFIGAKKSGYLTVRVIHMQGAHINDYETVENEADYCIKNLCELFLLKGDSDEDIVNCSSQNGVGKITTKSDDEFEWNSDY